QVVGRETGRRRGEGRADVDSGNRPQDPDPPHRPEEKREDPERETRGQPPRRGPQNRLLRGADIHPTEEEIEEHRGQRERDDDLDRMRLHLLSGKEFLTVVLTFHGRVSAEKNEAKFLARLTFRTVFPILSIHFREDRSMSRPNSWLLGSLVVFAATLNAASASADPIGALETPTAGQVVSGVIPVSGYVLDFAGVDKVELFVDGSFRSRAQINIPRPDIIALFPQYANSPTRDPGYATSLNTRTLSAGPHLVTIRVTETGNTKTFDIATVSVAVSSANTNSPPFGAVDSPASNQIEVSGSFQVSGWAADDSGNIDHIDILVDGNVVAGAAQYGLPRPDVFALYPDVPNSLNSGFVANIDTTAFLNGIHTIAVRAFDGQGSSNVLGTRTVTVFNVGANLGPFGYLDSPLDKASIVCNSDVPFVAASTCPEPCFQTAIRGQAVPASYYKNVVAGWALDVGARQDRGAVSYVELMIDGQLLANTRRDCVRAGRVFANCY